jgi:hypothetical protein
MSKKKSSRARRSEASTNESKEVVKVPEVLEKRGDLRKVPPVQRMRGFQAELRKKLATWHQVFLTGTAIERR